MRYLLPLFLIFSFTAQAGKARCFNPTKTNSKKQLKLEEIAHEELRRAKSNYNLPESKLKKYDRALKNLLETGMPTSYQVARYVPLSRVMEELADTPTSKQLAIYYRKKIIESLKREDLIKAISKENDLIGVDFSAKVSFLGKILEKIDFSGKNLSKANLPRADLSKANLSKTTLTEANLTNAYLLAANLSYADLTDANLTNAYLLDADLSYATLFQTNLTKANLIGADLRGVDLSYTILTRATLKGAKYDSTTILPKALTKRQKNSMIFVEE